MIRLHSPISLRLQALLVCVLLGVYLLILLPAPESSDGKALAAVAVSWVRTGSPNMNSIVYTDYFMPSAMSYTGTVGIDGAVYAKKGVTPSIFLVPLVVLSDALPWLTTRTTLMLFNPLVITATALLLLRYVVMLGYRPRTGLVVAFSFGMATFAFAYAKTLFGEPLAGLLLLVAVIWIHQHGSARNMACAGITLGLLIGINTIYAALVPLMALLIVSRWRSLRPVIVFGVPIVVILILLGLYNLLRFGDPLNGGYRFGDGEGFIVPFTIGMYGLFLSPYRGLFWYSPLLLLALPAWLMLRKSHGWLSWAILVLVIAQALTFASWWSWHGGVVWAPRFLLPVLPLLTLLLAPLVDAMWTRKPLLLVFAAFFTLSTLITCLGAFYSYFPYIEKYLNTQYVTDNGVFLSAYKDEVFYDPTISPIIGHLAMFVAGMPLEPGWIQSGDWLYLLLPGGLIAVGVVQLFITMSRRIRLVLLAAVIVVALQFAVIRKSDYTPRSAFARTFQPVGTVVAATVVLEDALLDLKQNVPVITLTAPTSPDDAEVRSVWEYALRQREMLWFVNWFAPSDPQNWQEQALWQSAAFVSEQTLLNHRALLFDLHPDPPQEPAGWRFGAVALDAYGVEIRPEGVQVILRWSAAQAPIQHLTWFAHLLDTSGNIVAQQDRQPLGGYAPTETWSAGTVVEDRLFFPTASTADAETWHLRIGWLDPATSAPLPVTDPLDQPQTDPFVILPLKT